MRKFRKIESFSHSAWVYGRMEARKPVRADERLGLALEVHLSVLVEFLPIDRDTGVEDGVELVAVGPTQVERHESGDVRGGIDLVAIERGFEVVQLVGSVSSRGSSSDNSQRTPPRWCRRRS